MSMQPHHYTPDRQPVPREITRLRPEALRALARGTVDELHPLFTVKGEHLYELARAPLRLPHIPHTDLIILGIQPKTQPSIRAISFFIHATEDNTRIAHLRFIEEYPDTFTLPHRLVHPDYRGQGLGSTLLTLAEQTFQQLAEARQRTIRIACDTRQRGVMAWLMKHGYHTPVEDLATIQRIVNRDPQYQYHSLILADGMQRDEFVFPHDEQHIDREHSLNYTFTKDIVLLRITPTMSEPHDAFLTST